MTAAKSGKNANASSAGPPRVLIADDEQISRLKLTRVLSKDLGVEVLEAVDGEEAWELFQQNADVQFVISDWIMPKCDGPELCQRIRNLPNRRYTYFILLTGKTEQQDLLTGMASGADDYVRKPFDTAELKSRVMAGLRVIELEKRLETQRAELQTAYGQLSGAVSAAAHVQRRMLPTPGMLAKVARSENIKIIYSYESCESLGGDVLGMAYREPGRVSLFLADVSGHGIEASLSAVSLHGFIEALLHTHQDPVEIVDQANRYCNDEFSEQVYASLVYLDVYPSKESVRILVAGHPPVILLRQDGELVRVNSAVPPLGLFPDPPTANDLAELPIGAGDRLIAYTDGVIESRNPAGEFFSYDHLTESIRRVRSAPIDKLPELILKDVAEWRGVEARPDDDITILAVQPL